MEKLKVVLVMLVAVFCMNSFEVRAQNDQNDHHDQDYNKTEHKEKKGWSKKGKGAAIGAGTGAAAGAIIGGGKGALIGGAAGAIGGGIIGRKKDKKKDPQRYEHYKH